MTAHKAGAKQKATLVAMAMMAISIHLVSAAEEQEYRSQYIGQEQRSIKGLSDDDIDELARGAGWGLAKAAELNGLPGPKHVLEMKDEIDLTAEQELKMQELYEDMKAKAIVLGQQLIAQERELDTLFADGGMDESKLDELLTSIAGTYKSLRYTHLYAHLQAPHILSEEQIRKYNELRGYSSGDPCANIPQGHDPVMWRKHNNCDS